MALPSSTPSEDLTTGRLPNSPSIAVLPFVNMSADPENEYFCDGLAEELLNALAKIDNLKVTARSSAFSFKGKKCRGRRYRPGPECRRHPGRKRQEIRQSAANHGATRQRERRLSSVV